MFANLLLLASSSALLFGSSGWLLLATESDRDDRLVAFAGARAIVVANAARARG